MYGRTVLEWSEVVRFAAAICFAVIAGAFVQRIHDRRIPDWLAWLLRQFDPGRWQYAWWFAFAGFSFMRLIKDPWMAVDQGELIFVLIGALAGISAFAMFGTPQPKHFTKPPAP